MLSKEQIVIAENVANAMDALSEEIQRLDKAGLRSTSEELVEYLHNISEFGVRTNADSE